MLNSLEYKHDIIFSTFHKINRTDFGSGKLEQNFMGDCMWFTLLLTKHWAKYYWFQMKRLGIIQLERVFMHAVKKFSFEAFILLITWLLCSHRIMELNQTWPFKLNNGNKIEIDIKSNSMHWPTSSLHAFWEAKPCQHQNVTVQIFYITLFHYHFI